MSSRFAEIEASIERIGAVRPDVEALLGRMDQDLRTAEKLRQDDPTWTLTIAHQAIHNGCVALMAAWGYRPRVNGHHRTAIRFARLALPEHAALLRQADLLRRERHRAVYGDIEAVPHADAEASIRLARRLTQILREAALAALEEQNTGNQ
ncbi:MAG: HEPN domain-containing protein [bacterium]|nr:HEPN domain-containing protein [bacterium]